MFDVTIYTDGACSGNPGVGGYAAIIDYKGHKLEVAGYSTEITTNNRMELKAVIDGIKALKKPCHITVCTDSQYVRQGTTHDKKWLTAENRPNKDLWMELITAGLKGQHKIKFVKVAGHSGIAMNELADKIAKEQCAKARHMLGGK